MAAPVVKVPGGGVLEVYAEPDWDSWHVRARGKVSRKVLEDAARLAAGYRYSPGDGYPGHYLTRLVAEAVGGEAVLPPVPPLPPGAVS